MNRLTYLNYVLLACIAAGMTHQMFGCSDAGFSGECRLGTFECECKRDDSCNDGLQCIDGWCESEDGSDPNNTHSDSESDMENDDACDFTCSPHCLSIGGEVKDGECEDEEHKCCDLGGSDGDTDADADWDADAPDVTREFDMPHKMFVGNITTWQSVRSDFLKYWDQITPENEGKWDAVEAMRDNMSWQPLESVYDFAKENNIPFKQHTMVWGSQYPHWIDNLSSGEQAEEIEEWIRRYCEKFPETDMIDVVNEAIEGHKPAYFAQKAFGDDWIVRSFELTHQYCPNAVLILNDYNVLRWHTQEFLQIAEPVADEGLLDAVGCQAHGLGGGDMGVQDINELSNNLDKIATLDVAIYISEYDIEQTNDNQQLKVMQEQFPLFYEHPSVVGITYWGYIVGRTWRTGTGLMSENGTPRPALDWLMDYLNR